MELLSSYIPIDRRRAIPDGQTIPDRLDGAVLFADICGFTPLTMFLQKMHGSRLGPEELTKYLNQIYETIIFDVHQHGGSVINFSGDGILCWFDDTLSNRMAALQAAACGSAMQASIQSFDDIDLNGNIINFELKVAIAAGSVRRFQVGDPQIQYIDILAGQTVDRTAWAEKLAQAGEVIVSNEVIAWLGERVTVREWRSDPTTPTADKQSFAVIEALSIPYFFRATLPNVVDDLGHEEASKKLTDSQIRPWLLCPVYERLEQGHNQFLAEIRQAVALFLEFSGINYDQDEEAYQKVDAYIRLIQNVLAVYGGHLIQVTIGDKGSYLYASFGALLAHDDDPGRAVAAALLLRSLSKSLDFISDVKIGISRGTVYGGAYGGKNRRTYGVLGDEVNVAVHLMTRARPGQIITTARIVKAASTHSFEFQALGRASLKGRTELLPIFAVRGKKKQKPYLNLDGVTLGHAMERSLIIERLQALTKGHQSQIIVTGEAGIGKTNLLNHLLTQAQHLNLPTFMGRADAIEQSPPYHAWRSIFQRIFDIDERFSEAQLRQCVLARLATKPLLLERTPLLNAVLPLNLPDNELTAQMTGQTRVDNTCDFLVQVLVACQPAQSGMVLALDDAQWLDSASWSLVLAITQTLHPFLLFVTLRAFDSSVPDNYDHLVNSANTYHFILDGLSEADTGKLLRNCLKTAHISAEIIEIIHKKAEGNPLFSRELAFALRDKGLIQVDRHTCQPAPHVNKLKDITIPDTVEEIVISRVDQLTAAQQLTLKVAAIIGPVFSYSTLYHTYPIEEDRSQLLSHLEAAEQLNLISREVTPLEPTYVFSHSIIQQIVYDLLLFSQKRCLHHTVAQWYEQYQPDKIDQYHPILAHHWRQAGNVQKTLEHLEKAGNYALQSGAFKEAVAFFEEIVELKQQADDKILKRDVPEVTARLVQARRGAELRQLEKQYINFEQALAIFDRSIPIGIGRGVL